MGAATNVEEEEEQDPGRTSQCELASPREL
jgi:hypothetical protein